jgi:predicted porin
MKKTILAAVGLSALATAHAQSTVTLYGLLDTNIQNSKTNVVVGSSIRSLSQPRIDGAGLNGSRWGLRINEDLGGGLAAVANLESGFDSSTGASLQGGLLFGRRANVGLSGSLGTVVIGRNTSSYDEVGADHAMMAQSIFDPSNVNNGNPATTAATLSTPSSAAAFLNRNTAWIGYGSRFNNSVKYNTPVLGGFSGSVMYALGEDKVAGAGGVTIGASQTISASVKYANGPLLLSAGYQSEGVTRTASSRPALVNTLLSATYNFGVVQVGAAVNRAKYKDVAAPTLLGQAPNSQDSFAAQNEWSLSIAIPVGATRFSVGYAQSKGDTLGKSSGFGVQALYSLSKRTTLYAGALTTSQYDRLASLVQTGAIAGYTPGASDIQRVVTYGVGIRHTF